MFILLLSKALQALGWEAAQWDCIAAGTVVRRRYLELLFKAMECEVTPATVGREDTNASAIVGEATSCKVFTDSKRTIIILP